MKKIFYFLFNIVFIIFFINCLNENDKLFSNDNKHINNNGILNKNILKNNIIKYLNNNNDNMKNKKFNSENIINLNKNSSENSSENIIENISENNKDSNENSDSEEEDKYLDCFPNKTYFILTIIIFVFIIIFVIFVSIFKYCPKKNNFEEQIQISFTEINQEKNDKILYNDK